MRDVSDPGHDVSITVNLSSRQLTAPDLVEKTVAMLHSHGLSAEDIDLEITENLEMDSAVATYQSIRRLKEVRIELRLDDFGPGYSSMDHLHRILFDALKIDRFFIGRMGSTVDNSAIVQVMITLAHNLGLRVVAEGIETEGQLNQLISFDCDYG